MRVIAVKLTEKFAAGATISAKNNIRTTAATMYKTQRYEHTHYTED